MAETLTTPNTLLGALLPEARVSRRLVQAGAVVLGTVALAVAAKIQVPVWPVHITLQSMVVAMLAGVLGWRLGVATVALYIAQGLAGLPVFSTGGGIGYIFSPSFGFIIGWLPMAAIAGYAAERFRGKVLPTALGMLAGNAVSFAFGFAWLMLVANMILASGGTLPAWLASGDLLAVAWKGAIEPFIVWDILKMVFAALTVAGALSLVRRSR
jgi:biotin transport system substrate-specific component